MTPDDVVAISMLVNGSATYLLYVFAVVYFIKVLFLFVPRV